MKCLIELCEKLFYNSSYLMYIGEKNEFTIKLVNSIGFIEDDFMNNELEYQYINTESNIRLSLVDDYYFSILRDMIKYNDASQEDVSLTLNNIRNDAYKKGYDDAYSIIAF